MNLRERGEGGMHYRFRLRMPTCTRWCAALVVLLALPRPAAADVPAALRSSTTQLVREMLASGALKETVALPLEDQGGEQSKYSRVLWEQFCTEWHAQTGWLILTDDDVTDVLARVPSSPQRVRTTEMDRRQVLGELNAEGLLAFSSVVTNEAVVLRATWTPVSAADSVVAREVVCPLSTEVRSYFAIPIPGRLEIRAPGDARVSVGDQVFTQARGKLSLQLPPGQYPVSISQPGFRTYSTKLDVRAGGARTTLKVREYDTSSMPLLSMLCSAAIPGSGPIVIRSESNPAGAFAVLCALTFYASGSAYVVDRGKDEGPFLTASAQNSHRRYKRVELGIAAGSYVLNVLSSFASGRQYSRSHKRFERYSLRLDPSPIPVVASREPETGVATNGLVAGRLSIRRSF